MYEPTSLASGVILLRRPVEVLAFVEDLNEAIAALGLAWERALDAPAGSARDAHVADVTGAQERLLGLRDALRDALRP